MHLAQLSGKHHPASAQQAQSAGAFRSAMDAGKNLLTHQLRSTAVIFVCGVLLGVLIGSDIVYSRSKADCNCGSGTALSSSADDAVTQQSLFPVFHPAPHGYAKRQQLITTAWTRAERRWLPMAGNAQRLLDWDWLNVRPHINVLPVFTVAEALSFLRSYVKSKSAKSPGAESRKKRRARDAADVDNTNALLDEARWLLSSSAHELLLSSSSSSAAAAGATTAVPHDGDAPAASNLRRHSVQGNKKTLTEALLFPLFVQTKYGFQGQSAAVVGGLYDAADGTLLQTAVRELREELGVRCDEIVPLGRWVVDGNRGAGQFQSHFARKCSVVRRSSDDRAAADLEQQQLVFVTRDDLVKLLHRTRVFAEQTLRPIENADGGRSFPAFLGSKDVAGAAGPVIEVDELVIKEAKWYATISGTLLALEGGAAQV